MTKIIAELCQNHNGDIKVLEDMVHAAAESGADFAKIQSIHSSDLAYRERFEHGLIEGGKINTGLNGWYSIPNTNGITV